MKLYIEVIKLLIGKFILRKKNGILIKKFAIKNGIVYIKLAQMLATQNFGNLFTEKDRQMLSSICDDCNPISYNEVERILKKEYGNDLGKVFKCIEEEPVGSASVSQVHKAILKTGEEVAIKIKRRDITKTIEKDLKRIRKIVHHFGKFVNFKNYTGGDYALELYLKWILDETDFVHEKENIKLYQNFADTVNGKISGTKKIKLPKVYEEYCTENVIVMEFINARTINKMELTSENKERIVTAFNSYLQLSFWAMFNDKQIVFHGDPHSGNICVDENGNIVFLDMGLLCALSDKDAKLCRTFFLAAYSSNYEKMYNLLVSYGDMDNETKKRFKEDCKSYCEGIKNKEVTYYFIDMLNICLYYEFVPPDFLFNMAKAFVCLNGINNFTNNNTSAKELLQGQTIEFLIKRSLKDCKDILFDGLCVMPKLLDKALHKENLITAIKETTDEEIESVRNALDNFNEMLDLIKL